MAGEAGQQVTGEPLSASNTERLVTPSSRSRSRKDRIMVGTVPHFRITDNPSPQGPTLAELLQQYEHTHVARLALTTIDFFI